MWWSSASQALAMWVSRRSVAPTEPVRETASMTGEYTQTDRFRGSRIHLCDLAGLEIRDCEVSGLKIVDCYGRDVYLGGDFERLVVNDVDVTMYVEAQLDRQHPARVLARDAASPTTTGLHGMPWRRCGRRRSTAPGCCTRPSCTSGSTANGRLSRRDATTPAVRQRCLARQCRARGRSALPSVGPSCRRDACRCNSEARAQSRSHPDAQRGARAAAPSHGHDAARRREPHARPSLIGHAAASRRRRIPTRSMSCAAASGWC